MHRRDSIRILAGLAVATGLALGATTASAADLKVGFVYVGPVGDHGWTYRHDIGRQAIEAEFGDRIETTFVESVKEGADAERVVQQLAASGHGLIFTTSFGFMNPTAKVAKRNPKVMFEHATGYKRSDNLSTYMARFYEGRYVSGVIAGKMTKSNVVGYVASFPIPEVVRGINAFILGAHTVNPDVSIKVVWVNSWYDPGKEGDAAKTLIDQGADMIAQHTDSPAPLQVAENRGVQGFGQASDMIAFAPKAQLTSIIDDWNGYYVERTKAVLEGNWESGDTWGGMDVGMVAMAPFTNMPDDVAALAQEITDKITSGELHPFTGPIKNQAGEVVVPDGETVSDEELLKMDWYVMGVEGSVPK